MADYETTEENDGTYTVTISGGDTGVTAIIRNFKNEREARDYIAEHRNKAGHVPGWSETSDDE